MMAICISLNDSCQIDPKKAIPRTTHQRSQRFFIGGLSPNTTNESMKAVFQQFGSLVDVNVMFDRETGRNKRFAFATFEDLSEQEFTRIVSGQWEVDGKLVCISSKNLDVESTIYIAFIG